MINYDGEPRRGDINQHGVQPPLNDINAGYAKVTIWNFHDCRDKK